MPYPYKVIDVPLKEKQKYTVKLVEAVPDNFSQGKSDGESSDHANSDFRVIRKSDSKSVSSGCSDENIEEKMSTLQLKRRRPSIDSLPSNLSPARTDELMD